MAVTTDGYLGVRSFVGAHSMQLAADGQPYAAVSVNIPEETIGPDATTGDLSPIRAHRLREAIRAAAAEWYFNNCLLFLPPSTDAPRSTGKQHRPSSPIPFP